MKTNTIALYTLKLTVFLAAVTFTAFSAQGKGNADGGGGGPHNGRKPSIAMVESYISGYAAVRVLGFLNYADRNPLYAPDPLRKIMAGKLTEGIRIELREGTPCLDENGIPTKVSSIFSPIADICFNTQMFVDQKDVSITENNFDAHVDALLLHEITHLAQKFDHGSISLGADEAYDLGHQTLIGFIHFISRVVSLL